MGFSCGFPLDFSYGFSVGFSFYWFWFGFGMGFSAGLGCSGDSWVVLSWWLENCLPLLLCWVAVIVGKEREPEWGGESNQRERERKVERIKNNKILNARATVIVHICTDTVAVVHLCTLLHLLMWVFFFFFFWGSKCVKWGFFLHFTRLCICYADALRHAQCIMRPKANIYILKWFIELDFCF